MVFREEKCYDDSRIFFLFKFYIYIYISCYVCNICFYPNQNPIAATPPVVQTLTLMKMLQTVGLLLVMMRGLMMVGKVVLSISVKMMRPLLRAFQELKCLTRISEKRKWKVDFVLCWSIMRTMYFIMKQKQYLSE